MEPLAGEAATKEAVLAALSAYPVLHLSCHGFANSGEPLESSLLLAHDERLALRDILAVQLGAEHLLYNRDDKYGLLRLAYSLCPVTAADDSAAWRAVVWSGSLAALLGREAIMADTDDPDCGPCYLKRLLQRLVEVLRGAHLPAVERAAAGNALAVLGDPRPGVGVKADGTPDIVWCEIPAGPFLMGSSDEDTMAFDDEKPQHTFVIPMPYYLSRYPVTQAQYAAFVKAGGYAEQRYWTAAGWERKEREGWAGPERYGASFDLPNHPVVGVSWYEAVAFCRWLEEQLKATGSKFQVWKAGQMTAMSLPPGAFDVQLPGEPEWEKAARGEDGRQYPWGNDIDAERMNYEGTGIGATSAVGVFPGGASLYGVLDLSGNVWEWCRTKWQNSYRQYRNDVDLAGNTFRVVRGGAFGRDERDARCASRNWYNPFSRDWDRGFRVVLSLSTLDSDPLGL